MTKDSDLALLDDDTIKAAYAKALEPFKFQVWIECKIGCYIEDDNPRPLEILWDPVGAIEYANRMRDQRHETWIKVLKLDIHESHQMNQQNIICLMCGERAEALEKPCEGV